MTQQFFTDREVVARTEKVARRYPGVIACEDVSFEVHAGEVRAIIGANGAGKSTLIKLLAGVERPDEGKVYIRGQELETGGVRAATALGVATVHQELSLIPELTIAENMYLGHWPRNRMGLDFKEMREGAERVLSSLGVDLDPRLEVGALKMADQQIVEIARALHESPQLLILDEPTSALAMNEVTSVLETIRQVAATGVAVIYVSHRMDEIRKIADTVTVMRDGKLVVTTAVKDASTAQIVSLMLGESTIRDLHTITEPAKTGDVLLELREVSIAPKVSSVSFEVRAGEVVGLAGLLGTGRTEILRAIAGYQKISSGQIWTMGVHTKGMRAARMRKIGVGLTPENRKDEGIVPELGIDENIVMSNYQGVSTWGVLSRVKKQTAAARLHDELSMKASDMSMPIATLSGGNQQKAVIGRWLYANTKILLLDEPTHGVDVESKGQIYQIVRGIAQRGSAVVFVSSEIEELPLVCDRVIAIRNGVVAAEFQAPNISLPDVLATIMAD